MQLGIVQSGASSAAAAGAPPVGLTSKAPAAGINFPASLFGDLIRAAGAAAVQPPSPQIAAVKTAASKGPLPLVQPHVPSLTGSEAEIAAQPESTSTGAAEHAAPAAVTETAATITPATGNEVRLMPPLSAPAPGPAAVLGCGAAEPPEGGERFRVPAKSEETAGRPAGVDKAESLRHTGSATKTPAKKSEAKFSVGVTRIQDQLTVPAPPASAQSVSPESPVIPLAGDIQLPLSISKEPVPAPMATPAAGVQPKQELSGGGPPHGAAAQTGDAPANAPVNSRVTSDSGGEEMPSMGTAARPEHAASGPARTPGVQPNPVRHPAAESAMISMPAHPSGAATTADTRVAANPEIRAAGAGSDPAPAPASSQALHGSPGSAFERIDSLNPPQLVHSGPQHLSVGVRDSGLGWVEVRAHSAAGQISAVVATGSTAAHSAVSAELPAMREYLAGQHVRVDHLSEAFTPYTDGREGSAGNQSGRDQQRGTAPVVNHPPAPVPGAPGAGETESVSYISIRV